MFFCVNTHNWHTNLSLHNVTGTQSSVYALKFDIYLDPTCAYKNS